MVQGHFPLSSLDGYTMTDNCARGGHCHDQLELGWCHEGSGTVAVNGRYFQFKPRSVFVIAPDQRHYIQSTCGNISIWTFLYIDLAALLSGQVPDKSLARVDDLCGPHFQHILNEEHEPAICQVVSQMVAELRLHQDQWQDSMRQLCSTLAVHFKHLSGRQQPDPVQQALREELMPAIDKIMRHYRRPLSTEDLARACGMETAQLNRQFEQVFNCIASELLTRSRVQRAADLLRHSSSSMQDIAVLTGFGSEQRLQQEFKQRIGVAAIDYRRGH